MVVAARICGRDRTARVTAGQPLTQKRQFIKQQLIPGGRKPFRKGFSGVTFYELRPVAAGFAAAASPTRPAASRSVRTAPAVTPAVVQREASNGSHHDRWVRYQSTVAASADAKSVRGR
ncbi:hypothetical protein GCM10010503_45370 [Streptomyces lucensis JCM 4490]|uniref:Uncharacterized protein n=1 Tax=Streptomyces lucensis JCM 4490 TaxID=1306176 RepID=A0A918MS73_9ACTN|nr:hypothetical protein GCM10010503_45370 [Streptomyces lucensis JCM 4490]